MPSRFQLVGIDHEPFQSLFDLFDVELAERCAKKCSADESLSYPCRISLEDAQLGEELLLSPYVHHPATSPYRASGLIFVRHGVQKRRLTVGEMPRYVTDRLISVRAPDAVHMMVAATVSESPAVASEIET